ncbi:response regulator [Roseateles sp.]|uniref:response regulator n=1 Tax=Roseateles sp. TaxID=1971397 RepID=UPI0039E91A55
MSRIYLIDDHAIMRDGLRVVLEAAGHEVIGEAAGPTPALADLGRLQPDVVLLDLRLGQRSGLELLAELHKRGMQLRVIVLTMSDQPRHVAEALRLGARGYLLKGSASSEVLQAVETVAVGGRFLSPQAAEFAASALTESGGADEEALSPRERQILLMVAQGATSNAIGEALHLSPKSVDTYRSRLMKKLGLNDITGLVKWALREGLISLDDR